MKKLTVQLRIPRLRRKLSEAEARLGCTLDELRPSAWNRLLPVDSETRVKMVLVRVVELGFRNTPTKQPPVVLSRHQGFARLVGKSFTITQKKYEEARASAEGPHAAVFHDMPMSDSDSYVV
jgi:hypothetical protein